MSAHKRDIYGREGMMHTQCVHWVPVHSNSKYFSMAKQKIAISLEQ